MLSKRRRFARRLLAGAVIVAATMQLSGCWWDDDRDLLRSDASTAGYNTSMQYTINATPNGDGEKNEITFRGMNNASPMPLLTTSFGKGARSNTQLAQLTSENGSLVNVLSMNRIRNTIGLTNYLDVSATTYEQRDVLNNRVCGAKVRLNYKPNFAQMVQNKKGYRAWDSLFYYSIPCGSSTVPTTPTTGSPKPGESSAAPKIVKPDMVLDLGKAKLIALVIDQQFAPRLVREPIVINRGHSVTIVGGRAASLVGGWWDYTASQIAVSKMVTSMADDLDKHEWLSFSDSTYGGLVYSAGDADVYASLSRIFLNRQDDPYLVNFRSNPAEPWKRILMNPIYNSEWNDLWDNYEALTGKDAPDIDDMVDKNTGLPKDIDDPSTDDSKAIKEIETAGCQNCPNAALEQIQFLDYTEGSKTYGKSLYAMTIRGWLGSQSSLVMFGKTPSGKPSDYDEVATKHMNELGMTECPIQYNSKGEKQERQYSQKECDEWLREGALQDLLTKDASTFGFDLVGQFTVRDNSSWASNCSGSGDTLTCSPTPTNRRLDASYLFTDSGEKMQKAWTILQLLGEVGMRTYGLSYASGQYDGSGLDFAMAQPRVYDTYYTNMADPNKPYNNELLFALDARALQLPNTLGAASQYLYGLN